MPPKLVYAILANVALSVCGNGVKYPMQTTDVHSALPDFLRFLVAGVHASPNEQACARIDTFLERHGNSPDSVIALCNAHGVLPLVYHSLQRLCQQGSLACDADLLQGLLSRMQVEYREVARFNMLLSAELGRITASLTQAGIDAVGIKGPTLAQLAYGDITLRQFGDIDILVNRDQAFMAAKQLLNDGHTAPLPVSLLSSRTCLDVSKDYSLVNTTGHVHTELHWRLFEKKYIYADAVVIKAGTQSGLQTVIINAKPITTLSNELLIVYLCLHGAKHAFERLLWLCDIDRLIRHTELDWDRASEIAHGTHSLRSFHLGLHLAHSLLDTPLPDALQSCIHNGVGNGLIPLTLRSMARMEREKGVFKNNRRTFLYQLKLFDSPALALRFYFRTLFGTSTKDCQTFQLPDVLRFLYPLLRPFRLAAFYFGRLCPCLRK